ncbi:MAG: hypothetical protein JNK87_04875 [Bryobacterales bacterium]|nr:hypothetical protein [Bryobacterales bacterium]
MAGKVGKFFQHVLPGVIRPIMVLWNEMIGFVFIVLGLVPLPSAYRAWRELEAGTDGPFRLLLTVSFSVVMLYFGITSFLRARKIQRS